MNNHKLMDLYSRTDLDYYYVHTICLKIGIAKMIEITAQTTRIWYVEFLKLGWDKKKFNKRADAVKRAKVYGGIDIALWIGSELKYSEYELQKKIKARIDAIIKTGKKKLKEWKSEDKIEFHKINETDTKLAAIQQFDYMLYEEKQKLIEKIKNETQKKERQKIINAKVEIEKLSDDEKNEIIDMLIGEKIAPEMKEPEKLIMKKHLHFWYKEIADLGVLK